MKPTTRIFLSSAAGVIGACSVQAADLPARKTAPQYLEVCAVHGPSFFYIPGTDTCVRIGGRVRYEAVVTNAFNKASDPAGFFGQGRLAIDARTQTEWGLLRAYTRISFNRGSGAYFGALPLAFGGYTNTYTALGRFPSFAGVDTAFRLNTGLFISAAVVQWGGLTAGRLQSFFDFYADNDTWFGITDSDITTQVLAYTYTFGSGFSATVSIEDPIERQRYPIAGTGAFGTGTIVPNTVPAALAANYANYAINYPMAANPLLSGFGPLGVSSFSQRENVPDVVGNIRVDQAWGSAQLSATWHHLSTSGALVTMTAHNAGGFNTVAGGFSAVTGNGWAVQGGVKLNLPMITAGDYLYLQAAYAKGEFSAVDSGFSAPFLSTGLGVGGTTFSAYDAVIGPGGKMTLTPAYSAMFSLEHYWNPTVRSGFFGGVAHINYSAAIRTAAGYATGAACPNCADTVTTANGSLYNPYSPFYDGGNAYSVGANLIWSPVQDLDIGVEVAYRRNQMQHKEYNSNSGYPNLIKEDDTFWYRLRISREF